MDEGWVGGPTILASAWRYRVWVVVAALLAGTAGWFWSQSQEPLYEAHARIFLADDRNDGVFGALAGRDNDTYVPQQAERLKSGPVLAAIAESTGLSTSRINRNLDVDPDAELALLEIRAESDDPQEAADLANAAVAAYQSVTLGQRQSASNAAVTELRNAQFELDAQVAELRARKDGTNTDDTLDAQIDILVRERVELGTRVQQLLVDANLLGSGVELVEEADTPDAPFTPQSKRDATMFAILGMALAVAGAYLRAGSATKIEDRHAPAEILGIPLLGTLPIYEHPQGVDTLEQRLAIEPSAMEAYHFLLSSVLHELFAVGGRTLMVTSANPGDGKTEVSLQLAAASVREGHDAILVDGDLRVRQLTRLAGAQAARGLLDLGPDASGAEDLTRDAVVGPNLHLPVLPAGDPTHRGAAIRQPGIAAYFLRAIESDTLTIVDSAPILATADTTVLAEHIDGLVLVVRRGIDRELLERVGERLRFLGCSVLGYIYVTPSEQEHRGGADYGYGEGYKRQVAVGARAADIPTRADASTGTATPRPADPAAEPEPVTAEPAPVAAEPVPVAAEPEPAPVAAEPEPAPAEPEPAPVAAEPEPAPVAAEPGTAPITAVVPGTAPITAVVPGTAPITAVVPDTPPSAAEPEHVAVEPEPSAFESEHVAVEPEPAAADEPVAAAEPEPAATAEPEPVAAPAEPEPAAAEPEPVATITFPASESSSLDDRPVSSSAVDPASVDLPPDESHASDLHEPSSDDTEDSSPEDEPSVTPPAQRQEILFQPVELSWSNLSFTNDPPRKG